MEYPHRFESLWNEEFREFILRNATPSDIEGIVYPEGIVTFTVSRGILDHLKIPDGVKSVYASYIGLRTIHVPDSVTTLRCNDNCLRHLELPSGIEHVDASMNQLALLSFRSPPTTLYTLDLSNNCFISLDIDTPLTLCDLDVSHNMYLDIASISKRTIKDMVQDYTEVGKTVFFRPERL